MKEPVLSPQDFDDLALEAISLMKQGWIRYALWGLMMLTIMCAVFYFNPIGVIDLPIIIVLTPLLYGSIAHSVVKNRSLFDANFMMIKNMKGGLLTAWKLLIHICMYVAAALAMLMLLNLLFSSGTEQKVEDVFEPNIIALSIFSSQPMLATLLCLFIDTLTYRIAHIIASKAWGMSDIKTQATLKLRYKIAHSNMVRSRLHNVIFAMFLVGVSIPLFVSSFPSNEFMIIAGISGFIFNLWASTYLYLLTAKLLGKSTKIEETVKETVTNTVASGA